jgi:hypothetical protein
MTHEGDEEARCWSSPWPHSVIDQVFERLTMLSSQLESASLARCKLNTPLRTAPYLHSNRKLPHYRNSSKEPDCKSSTNGRSPFKANGLQSACDERGNKVKAAETNLVSTAAKFDAGLASLALLQRQHQQLGLSGNGDIENGFPPHGSRNWHGG